MPSWASAVLEISTWVFAFMVVLQALAFKMGGQAVKESSADQSDSLPVLSLPIVGVGGGVLRLVMLASCQVGVQPIMCRTSPGIASSVERWR
jgi:hypothetical protein